MPSTLGSSSAVADERCSWVILAKHSPRKLEFYFKRSESSGMSAASYSLKWLSSWP